MELAQLHVNALVLQEALGADEAELHGALAQQSVLVEHFAGLEQRQVRLVELILTRGLGCARDAKPHWLEEAELNDAVTLRCALSATHAPTATAVVAPVEHVKRAVAHGADVGDCVFDPARRLLVPSELHLRLNSARARAVATEERERALGELLLLARHVHCVVVIRDVGLGRLEAPGDHGAEPRSGADARLPTCFAGHGGSEAVLEEGVYDRERGRECESERWRCQLAVVEGRCCTCWRSFSLWSGRSANEEVSNGGNGGIIGWATINVYPELTLRNAGHTMI